jgi:hypothetical protein
MTIFSHSGTIDVMMVILSKSRLIAFAVVVCLILAALGWHGYNLVTSLGDSGIETRLAAEEILFASIAAILIVVILAVILLRRAASLDKRLDRLIEQGRNSEIVPGRDFSTMGPLGDKLRDLFNLLSQSNYQKTRKISAMQALVIFLIRNQDQAIVICDSAGIVRYVSDVFLEKRQLTRVDVLDFSCRRPFLGFPWIKSPRSSPGPVSPWKEKPTTPPTPAIPSPTAATNCRIWFSSLTPRPATSKSAVTAMKWKTVGGDAVRSFQGWNAGYPSGGSGQEGMAGKADPIVF